LIRPLSPAAAIVLATAALAQPPANVEFEVASLKASAPPDGRGIMIGCRGGPETKDPIQYTCQNMDLSNFVTMAYGMSYYQLTAPDWMRTVRFDLRAKVPEGATKDQLKLMVQSMLVERFKLAVHHETRELAKFDLVVAKSGPRLKPAGEAQAPKDPASEPPRPPGPPPRDKDGYPILGSGRPGMAMMNGKARMYDPGMTMEALAARLGGQMGKPVTDATGLQGKYEVSLFWSAEMMRAPPAVAAGVGPIPMASTPEGDSGPTLQQALQDQLGLRLEAKKGPVDFLVVDHMEKAPSEN
jgi:uncharacterized protein (TIGR03435 family)